MPKKMERKLQRAARRKGLKGKALNRYVYGTLRSTGWRPKRHRRR
jgi:hypothetical protein